MGTLRRPFTRDQRTAIVYGMLAFVLILVILQLWLLTATMNACHRRRRPSSGSRWRRPGRLMLNVAVVPDTLDRAPDHRPVAGLAFPHHDVDLQLRVGRGNVGGRQAELGAHDVAPLRDRAGLVERDLAVAPLPSEPAVARHDELLDRDVDQRLPDLAGDLLGAIGLQRAVADGADIDLLLQVVAERRKQLDVLLVPVFHLECPDIAPAPFE